MLDCTSSACAEVVTIGEAVAATTNHRRTGSAIDFHLLGAEMAATRSDWKSCEACAASAAWRLVDLACVYHCSTGTMLRPHIELELVRDARGQGAHRSLLLLLPAWVEPAPFVRSSLQLARRAQSNRQPLVAATWTGVAMTLATAIRGGDPTDPVQGLDIVTGHGVRVQASTSDQGECARAALAGLRKAAQPAPITDSMTSAEAVLCMLAWAETCDSLIRDYAEELTTWVQRLPDGSAVWNHRAPALHTGDADITPQLLLAMTAGRG